MKTVCSETSIEYVIEKSRFIGYIKPVETQEEAESFIAEIRKKHWDASHNVPIYIIGERGEIQKCSDDGEPSGTSGPPVLQMLVKEQATNLVIVITRYFGGIKLGTGGLVRAYTTAAKMALEAAEICVLTELTMMSIEMDYPCYNRLKNLSQGGDFSVEEAEFSDVVKVRLSMPGDRADDVLKSVSELTGGALGLLSRWKETVKVKLMNTDNN